jgi:hypothetical protein
VSIYTIEANSTAPGDELSPEIASRIDSVVDFVLGHVNDHELE